MLSIGFLTLIIMSIILVTLMIAIMRNLKRISERAEVATSSVASVAESLSRKVAPLAFSGLVGMLIKRFGGDSKSSKKGR